MKQALCLIPVTDAQKQALQQAAPSYNFTFKISADKTLTTEEVEQAEIIIGNTSPKLISKAKNLKWFQLYSAGADAYVKPGILSENTILTNATGAYGLAVSEHMAAQLLELIKNLHLYRDNQNNSSWKDEGPVRSVRSCIILILGLGDIGSSFARIMKGFGAKVIGLKRRPGAKPDYLDELHLSEKLDELLPKVDVVAMCLPSTPETTNIMNAQRIASMKPGSFIINAGRGNAVDQNAVCAALISGQLGGFGTDVTEPEPLPADHPLWSMKNAVITPHVSGNFHIPEIAETVFNIALENLKRLQTGQELFNLVDRGTGYKA